MNPETIGQLGKALREAAADRLQIPCPSAQHPGFSLADAYAVQDALVQESLAHGRVLSGRKIGYARTPTWSGLGIREPCYGSMFRDRTFHNLGEMRFAELVEPQLEFEILFALKSDLDAPGIDAEAVLAATDYVAPAFEVIEARTLPGGRGMNDTVADNHSFGACLVGGPRRKPAANEIGAEVVDVVKNGESIHHGIFREIMESPLHSMVWLARKMLEKGAPLKAGELILSGSATPPIPFARNDAFTARYAFLGENTIRFI